jgi:hypothetical protein
MNTKGNDTGSEWFESAVPILDYATLPMRSGVYAIAHKDLEFVYVGVAKSIRRRIKYHIHDCELGQGLPGLDDAWRTHGPEALRVVVLEQDLPTVLLRSREDHWLRTLGHKYKLLNAQLHSNYVANHERQELRGVTYLIYGSVSAATRPLRDFNRDHDGGVGDIFALLDDGITSGGGTTDREFITAAIRTRRGEIGREFAVGVTLSRWGKYTTYRSAEQMLTAFMTNRSRSSELVVRDLDHSLESLLPALERLAKNGYEVSITVDAQSRAVFVKISRNKQNWYLRDVYALMPMSLEDLSILTGVAKPAKVARDLDYDPDKPEQVVLLRRDAEALFASYTAYNCALRECYGISPAFSAGSTALKAFRQRITPRQQRPEVAKYALRAYFGGLLFLIWVRSHRDIFDIDLDAASMIAMRRERDGDTTGCYGSKEYPDCPGIYLCEVSGPKERPLPFVPARGQYNSIWHTEEVRTYLCSHTIALARMLGYSIQVVMGFTF